MTPVYLDHNATSPLRAEALAAYVDSARAWPANPSSMHALGQAARRALAAARAEVAAALGAKPSEVVFTSGATESNHLAVLGALRRARESQAGRGALAISAIEHPGLLALARRLQREGVPVRWLPVTSDGVVDLGAARSMIDSGVALVSVMTANNETGVLQPIAALAEIARAAGALMHTDATQAQGLGSAAWSGADLVTTSAHKVGGPRGLGTLLIRGQPDWPAIFDGRQERARRGGTEALPAIAAYAAALRALAAETAAASLATLRDRLERELAARFDATVVGAGAPRLPHTSCVRFGATPAESVLARLDRVGVCASSGAACGSGRVEPSHVLLAMGLSPDAALAGVRFSLGHTTSAGDIDRAIAALGQAIGATTAEPPVSLRVGRREAAPA